MKKIGVFPGSFDPFTKGHEAVVRKALELFDELIIAIGMNSSKTSQFELSNRILHIQSLFQNGEAIQITTYSKLTVDLCKEVGAQMIVRGLRDSKDFEYEKSIAQIVFDRKLLNENGLLIIEHGRHTKLTELPNFELVRTYGNVYFSFFRLDA